MLKFLISLSGGSAFYFLPTINLSLDLLSPLRYKYLQKPLEESALPTLLQYIHRWEPAQKDKLSIAVGLLISQGLANAACLQSLSKDHLVKNGQSSYHYVL